MLQYQLLHTLLQGNHRLYFTGHRLTRCLSVAPVFYKLIPKVPAVPKRKIALSNRCLRLCRAYAGEGRRRGVTRMVTAPKAPLGQSYDLETPSKCLTAGHEMLSR